MRSSLFLAVLSALALAACQQPATAPRQSTTDAAPAPASDAPAPAPAAAPSPAPGVTGPAAPGTKDGLPDDRTPVAEGKIDAKSPQGAGSVVERYAGLLEQKQFAEAGKLWRGEDGGLTAGFAKYREVHAEIGAPGQPDGAAGNVYVSVPVQFYGKDAAGKDFRMKKYLTLKRVNDVPGSSAADREWHLSRVSDKQP